MIIGGNSLQNWWELTKICTYDLKMNLFEISVLRTAELEMMVSNYIKREKKKLEEQKKMQDKSKRI